MPLKYEYNIKTFATLTTFKRESYWLLLSILLKLNDIVIIITKERLQKCCDYITIFTQGEDILMNALLSWQYNIVFKDVLRRELWHKTKLE